LGRFAAGILKDTMNDALPQQFDRPMVIIGSPRSGTTHLGNLLGEYPVEASIRICRSLAAA
jgi:hypothetical protein